jgi:hypothetical protein
VHGPINAAAKGEERVFNHYTVIQPASDRKWDFELELLPSGQNLRKENKGDQNGRKETLWRTGDGR